MEFPKLDFADDAACFKALFDLVHPEGLRCPHCGIAEHLHVFAHHNQSCIPYFRCSPCRHKFSPWTGTVFEGTHHSPSELWRIMQRLTAGMPFTRIAKELGCQRARLSEFCHRIAPCVWKTFGPLPKKSPEEEPDKPPTCHPTSGNTDGMQKHNPMRENRRKPTNDS